MRRSGAPATVLLSALTALTFVAGCSSSKSDSKSSTGSGLEKTTIKVAALPVTDAAPLHIAEQEGLFKAEGLTVQIVPVQQSLQALPSLVKGDIDLVGGNYVSFLQAADKGTLKLKIVAEATTLKPNLVDVLALPKSGIKTPKDLEGKKVAVNLLNNVQSLTLNQILKANNVDPTKIKYVAIPFPQMAAALQAGQVDAIEPIEPFVTLTEEKTGAKVVVDGGSAPVADMPLSGYISTQDFVTKYPKTAAAFQRALFKAQQLATADRKQVEKVLPGFAKIDAQTAAVITMPGYPVSVNATRIQRLTDLMMSSGMLKQKPNMASILFNATS